MDILSKILNLITTTITLHFMLSLILISTLQSGLISGQLIYEKYEVCFPLMFEMPDRIKDDDMPTQQTLLLSCEKQKSQTIPKITSVLYSVPKSWSQFCTDRNTCCDKPVNSNNTYEKLNLCLHEKHRDEGFNWNTKCTPPGKIPTMCNVTIPRLNMKDICDFDFTCEVHSCWNRWVVVTYTCEMGVGGKYVYGEGDNGKKNLGPADLRPIGGGDVKSHVLMENEAAKAEQAMHSSGILLSLILIVVFLAMVLYIKKNNKRGWTAVVDMLLLSNRRNATVTCVIFVLLVLYVLYTA